MTEYIVKVSHATKRFKNTLALKDITVNFEKGKIHGIIGRNGSGKTLLFKAICGFLKLDEGEIYVHNKKVKPTIPQDIGIIIEEPGFIDHLSAFKNLKLLSSIKKKITDTQIKEAIAIVGLNPSSKKHVHKFSLGMRHRLAIAQAIMENPELLILDEPMNGLDKEGVLEMRELFKKLKQDGRTIILSSHYAEDIEVLCETVHEMDQGIMTKIR